MIIRRTGWTALGLAVALQVTSFFIYYQFTNRGVLSLPADEPSLILYWFLSVAFFPGMYIHWPDVGAQWLPIALIVVANLLFWFGVWTVLLLAGRRIVRHVGKRGAQAAA